VPTPLAGLDFVEAQLGKLPDDDALRERQVVVQLRARMKFAAQRHDIRLLCQGPRFYVFHEGILPLSSRIARVIEKTLLTPYETQRFNKRTRKKK
jgi:hypothetical protein